MVIMRSRHKAGKTISEAKSFKELVSLLSTVSAPLTTGVVHGHILSVHPGGKATLGGGSHSGASKSGLSVLDAADDSCGDWVAFCS